MKRWSLVVVLALLAGSAGWILLRPWPEEAVPLASFVPRDAIAVAAFRDHRDLARLPEPLVGEFRRRLAEAEPHLAGPVTLYLDREGEWVVLARLTRTSALFAGGEVVDGVAVAAQTPDAMARHKAREGSITALDAFAELGSPVFVNLAALDLAGRLRDYSAAGLEIDPGPPVTLRGRILYRGRLFQLYVREYIHAPKTGAPPDGPPVALSLVEHFPRLWDEILHDLIPGDRQKLEHEAFVLSRDFLGGRSVRDFLGKLGPACGLGLVPTRHGLPALVGWIDLPDEKTRRILGNSLHRAAFDIEEHYRKSGTAPLLELSVKDELWHVRFRSQEKLGLGDALSPAFAFRGNRIVLTSCADTLEPHGAAPEPAGHLEARIEVAGALELLRTMARLGADASFRPEAAEETDRTFRELFPPEAREALRRSMPDAYDRARFLSRRRAELEAQALARIASTETYREELARRREGIDRLAEATAWIKTVSASGTFTDRGLEIRLELRPTAP